jgi:hypothetical protein
MELTMVALPTQAPKALPASELPAAAVVVVVVALVKKMASK